MGLQQNRLVVVTGASRGAGKGIALAGTRPFWDKPLALADILDVGLRSHYVATPPCWSAVARCGSAPSCGKPVASWTKMAGNRRPTGRFSGKPPAMVRRSCHRAALSVLANNKGNATVNALAMAACPYPKWMMCPPG